MLNTEYPSLTCSVEFSSTSVRPGSSWKARNTSSSSSSSLLIPPPPPAFLAWIDFHLVSSSMIWVRESSLTSVRYWARGSPCKYSYDIVTCSTEPSVAVSHSVPTILHLSISLSLSGPHLSFVLIFVLRGKQMFRKTQPTLTHLGVERLALGLGELLAHPLSPGHRQHGEGHVPLGNPGLYQVQGVSLPRRGDR